MLYDAAIVGSGPAGMFAALELVKTRNLKIVIFERGPVRSSENQENLTSGWGGAGAFSDGKLDLGSCVGGTVGQNIGEDEFQKLMEYVDGQYRRFGGKSDLIDARQNKDLWEKVCS